MLFCFLIRGKMIFDIDFIAYFCYNNKNSLEYRAAEILPQIADENQMMQYSSFFAPFDAVKRELVNAGAQRAGGTRLNNRAVWRRKVLP